MMKRNGDAVMTMIYSLDKLPAETRDQILASPKWIKLFSEKPKRLLAIDTNAKTVKGQKKGFMTAILYLTPADGAGENVCPMAAIAACDEPCLNTAGRGAMGSVQMARLRKTLFYIQYREEFLAQIKREIAAAIKKADKAGFELLVRLNGTSDIRFENYGIMEQFPNVQFYDYTKIFNRKNVPANYDLTYSYSGVKAFQPFVQKAIANGMRIATVFRNRAVVEKMLANNETFMGMTVVDGDNSDVRHIDPQGVVVALYAKGRAKKDTSGFVVG
jgi:hypothetical protein